MKDTRPTQNATLQKSVHSPMRALFQGVGRTVRTVRIADGTAGKQIPDCLRL